MRSDDLLTQDRWELAADVMRGGCLEGTSKQLAASKAGVSVRVLNGWIARSREQRPEDEPWVWDIGSEVSGFEESRARILENKLWGQAMNGVRRERISPSGEVSVEIKDDPNLITRMLGVVDERWKKDDKNTVAGIFDVDDLFRKFNAVKKLDMARIEDIRDDTQLLLEVDNSNG